MTIETKTYLGDGVYAYYDNYNVWLSVEGFSPIAIEPTVMLRLIDYAKRMGQIEVPAKINDRE